MYLTNRSWCQKKPLLVGNNMKTIPIVWELIILLLNVFIPGRNVQLFVYIFSGVPSVGSIMKSIMSQKRYFDSLVVEILEIPNKEQSPHYCYLFRRLCVLVSCNVGAYSITSWTVENCWSRLVYIICWKWIWNQFKLSWQVTSLLSSIRVQLPWDHQQSSVWSRIIAIYKVIMQSI